MPAVTLQNRATQTSQNCGVRTAFFADTFSEVTSLAAFTFAGQETI
jgi:hypothetical protein